MNKQNSLPIGSGKICLGIGLRAHRRKQGLRRKKAPTCTLGDAASSHEVSCSSGSRAKSTKPLLKTFVSRYQHSLRLFNCTNRRNGVIFYRLPEHRDRQEVAGTESHMASAVARQQSRSQKPVLADFKKSSIRAGQLQDINKLASKSSLMENNPAGKGLHE